MDKLKTVILLAVISFGVAHSSHPLLEDGIDSSKKWIISQPSITQGKIDSCFKQVKRYNFLIKEARTNLEFLEEFKKYKKTLSDIVIARFWYKEMRGFPMKRFPYTLFYTIDESENTIFITLTFWQFIHLF